VRILIEVIDARGVLNEDDRRFSRARCSRVAEQIFGKYAPSWPVDAVINATRRLESETAIITPTRRAATQSGNLRHQTRNIWCWSAP